MTSFLQRLAASVFSAMLVVFSAWAQSEDVKPVTSANEAAVIETQKAAIEREKAEIEKLRSDLDRQRKELEKEVKVTVAIEKDSKEMVIKKPPRRSRSSSSTRTTYDDITMFGGTPVLIKKGESAREVVTFGSDVQVDGSVNGNLVVMFGNVRLGPESRIGYGPVIIGGNLTSEPGAKLGLDPTVLSLAMFGGATNVISAAFIEASKHWFTEGLLRARPLPPRLPAAWVASAFLALLFVVIGVIFQKPITSTVATLDEKPGSAFLLGLLVCALTLPALLLLIISLVGVVLVPFVLCALGVLIIVGKVSLYRYAGQTLGTQFGLEMFRNPLLALLLGTLLFYIAYAVPVIGAVVWLLALPLGVGAVALAGLNRGKSATAKSGAGLGVPAMDVPPELVGAQSVLLPRVGFWLRFVATFLDFVLVSLVMAGLRSRPEWFLLAWTLYHLALWSWKGTTIGGIILGLRIVRTDGSRMTIPVAVVRLLGSFFSAAVVGLGFFWAGWTGSCQSWHDKIAGTVVVRYPKNTPLV